LILFALFDQMLDRPTSIAIQFLRFSHRLTGERCARGIQGHRSPFKSAVFNSAVPAAETNRPGTIRRACKKPGCGSS